MPKESENSFRCKRGNEADESVLNLNRITLGNAVKTYLGFFLHIISNLEKDFEAIKANGILLINSQINWISIKCWKNEGNLGVKQLNLPVIMSISRKVH